MTLTHTIRPKRSPLRHHVAADGSRVVTGHVLPDGAHLATAVTVAGVAMAFEAGTEAAAKVLAERAVGWTDDRLSRQVT